MQQPWATLRALGLYKDPSAAWGIDYVSGSSMRMANEDNGFRRDELIDFVHRDGGFRFLPRWLHGEVDDDEETSWHEFLMDTFHRCKRFMIGVSAASGGAYVFVYLLASLVSIGLNGDFNEGARRFGWALVRLGVMYGTVLVLYNAAIKHVDKSDWACDIRNGLRYTSPFGNEESRFDGPTTFPYRNDVLIVSRYKSDYLAMHNDFVGNHPGNRFWNELVDEKASIFAVYDGLPFRFGVAVADYIVGALYKYALYQNAGANFVEISKRDALVYTIEELAIKSNTIAKQVLTELEFLISEAKYGHLRKSAMSKQHAFPFLVNFYSQLLASSPPSKRTTSVVRTHTKTQRSNQQFQPLRAIALPTLGAKSKPTRRPVVLKVGKFERSPYFHLQEGKIVDVQLKQDNVMRWYKAEIDKVMSTGYVSVVLLGSDEGFDIHRLKIRQYVAPRVGETVEVEVDDEYEEGIILQAKGNGLYDVEDDGDIFEDIGDQSFRRGLR